MLAIVFFVVLSSAFAARSGFKETANLEWRDCANDDDRWIEFNEFDISPSPIELPGDMFVKLQSDLTHQLKDAVTMNVVMEKELLGQFTKVVCVNGVGTCHYDDPCHFLNSFKGSTGCPKQFSDNGLPCSCPFNPTNIHFPGTKFTVSSISSEWSFLATGTYHIKITMTDKEKGKIRACMETYLKMQH